MLSPVWAIKYKGGSCKLSLKPIQWLSLIDRVPRFCSLRAMRRELMVAVICVMKLEKMPMANTTTPWAADGDGR